MIPQPRRTAATVVRECAVERFAAEDAADYIPVNGFHSV